MEVLFPNPVEGALLVLPAFTFPKPNPPPAGALVAGAGVVVAEIPPKLNPAPGPDVVVAPVAGALDVEGAGAPKANPPAEAGVGPPVEVEGAGGLLLLLPKTNPPVLPPPVPVAGAVLVEDCVPKENPAAPAGGGAPVAGAPGAGDGAAKLPKPPPELGPPEGAGAGFPPLPN